MLGSQDNGNEAEIQARAARVKELVRSEFGFDPMQETKAYVTYLIDRARAPVLPRLLKRLEGGREEFGVTDIQVRVRLAFVLYLPLTLRASGQRPRAPVRAGAALSHVA